MATPFVPYHPGTITVTNGSVNFTGSGTMLTAYSPGDALIVDGRVCRIETNPSNTAGTFALPYAGTGGSGKSYDWLPAAELTRATTLYTSFERLLVGGNLAAEAALDGTGGDKLSYFTGAGAKSLTALTAFARTLLDDSNASTVLSTLGVSTFIKTLLDDTSASAARTTLELLQVQTDTQDSTVDRLMRTGAFGLGTTGAPTVITNFNTVVAEASGLYAFASGASNGPPESFTGVLLVMNNSATARAQIAVSATGDGVMWMRKYSGGAWSTWKPVTPQFISNANGVAWRFANGLQICLRLTAFSVDVSSAATGAIFQGTTSWTFPAEFTSGSVVNAWSISGSTVRWGGNATGISGTGCTLRHFAGASSATGSNLFGVAIGQYT